MAWLLDERLAVDEKGNSIAPEWRYALNADQTGEFRSHTFIPSDEDLKRPIRIVLKESRSRLADYLPAPGAEGNLIVSKNFKELVETIDPERHYYIPVIIEYVDGRTEEGTHFLFKMGKFIDNGIIVEESDVKPRKFNPNGLYATQIPPRITWRATKVSGLHIWADARLESHIVVSNELMAKIRASDLSGYIAKESRLAVDS